MTRMTARRRALATVLGVAAFAAMPSVQAEDENRAANNWDEVARRVIPEVEARSIELTDFLRVYNKGTCIVDFTMNVAGMVQPLTAQARFSFDDKNGNGLFTHDELEWETLFAASREMNQAMREAKMSLFTALELPTSRAIRAAKVQGQESATGWKLIFGVKRQKDELPMTLFVDKDYAVERLRAESREGVTNAEFTYVKVDGRNLLERSSEIQTMHGGGEIRIERAYIYLQQDGCVIPAQMSTNHQVVTVGVMADVTIQLMFRDWSLTKRPRPLPRLGEVREETRQPPIRRPEPQRTGPGTEPPVTQPDTPRREETAEAPSGEAPPFRQKNRFGEQSPPEGTTPEPETGEVARIELPESAAAFFAGLDERYATWAGAGHTGVTVRLRELSVPDGAEPIELDLRWSAPGALDEAPFAEKHDNRDLSAIFYALERNPLVRPFAAQGLDSNARIERDGELIVVTEPSTEIAGVRVGDAIWRFRPSGELVSYTAGSGDDALTWTYRWIYRDRKLVLEEASQETRALIRIERFAYGEVDGILVPTRIASGWRGPGPQGMIEGVHEVAVVEAVGATAERTEPSSRAADDVERLAGAGIRDVGANAALRRGESERAYRLYWLAPGRVALAAPDGETPNDPMSRMLRVALEQNPLLVPDAAPPARGEAEREMAPPRGGVGALAKSVTLKRVGGQGWASVRYRYTRMPGFVFLRRLVIEWRAAPGAEPEAMELVIDGIEAGAGHAERYFAGAEAGGGEGEDEDDMFDD